MLWAVIDCLLDIQNRGPPSHIRYPEMERDLNKSRYVGSSVDFGTLASCEVHTIYFFTTLVLIYGCNDVKYLQSNS